MAGRKTASTAPAPDSEHAALRIQRAWRAHVLRRSFAWVRRRLVQVERSLPWDILKSLSPLESRLLQDPTLQTRIRFRLSGEEFPPQIVYKILCTGMNTHYFSGRRMIQAGTQSALDACRVMGPSKFWGEVGQEALLLQASDPRRKDLPLLPEPYDVQSKVDFVRYMSGLDSRPVELSGRNNPWRLLASLPLDRGVHVPFRSLHTSTYYEDLHSQLKGSSMRWRRAAEARIVQEVGWRMQEQGDLAALEGVFLEGNVRMEEEEEAQHEYVLDWARGLSPDHLTADYHVAADAR